MGVAVPTTRDGELLEHPAVQAWRRARPGTPPPRAVELVKRKLKSEVWRLMPGGDSAPLIAKL